MLEILKKSVTIFSLAVFWIGLLTRLLSLDDSLLVHAESIQVSDFSELDKSTARVITWMVYDELENQAYIVKVYIWWPNDWDLEIVWKKPVAWEADKKKIEEDLKIEATKTLKKNDVPLDHWIEIPTQVEQVKEVVSDNRVQKLLNAWVVPWLAEAMVKIADENKILPEYLAIVWLSENAMHPWGIGDKKAATARELKTYGWCSFWAYQFNGCAGKWRRWQVVYWKSYYDCARDYECSTRMLAERLTTVYWCKIKQDWTISNWNSCLTKHQWANPDKWYIDKVTRNGAKLF